MNSSKWLRRVTALALPVCVAAVPALASPSPCAAGEGGSGNQGGRA
jgi:hypothetical protein